jgi:hypothetical protein
MSVNPLRGQVEIELAGEKFQARLTIDSIIRIEETLDKGILQITQNIAETDIRMKDICLILYWALRGGGKDFKESEVRTKVQNAGIVESCKVVTGLLTSVLSDDSASGDDVKKDEGTS